MRGERQCVLELKQLLVGEAERRGNVTWSRGGPLYITYLHPFIPLTHTPLVTIKKWASKTSVHFLHTHISLPCNCVSTTVVLLICSFITGSMSWSPQAGYGRAQIMAAASAVRVSTSFKHFPVLSMTLLKYLTVATNSMSCPCRFILSWLSSGAGGCLMVIARD